MNAVNHADVALLTVEAAGVQQESGAMYSGKVDMGAARMLLEGNILFDIVDLESDWSGYKVLILPDSIVMKDVILPKWKRSWLQGAKCWRPGVPA